MDIPDCVKEKAAQDIENYNASGSVFSEGNVWIVCAVGAAAVIAVGAIVIVKKKKPAASDE